MISPSLFLAHLAFAQMLVCAMLLLPSWRSSLSVRLFVLLMLCGCGYLLGTLLEPLPRLGSPWWLYFISANALPGVFWLVSLSVFADRDRLQAWQYAVASLTLLIPLTATLVQVAFGFDLEQFPLLFAAVTYGALLLELVLISHAMAVAATHWQADLVQKRRYLRGVLIGVTAAYLLIVIVIEQLFQLEWSWLATAKHAVLVLLMTGILLLLFRLREGSVFGPARALPDVPAPARQAASPELQRIVHAMTVDRLYRQEGLTIAALSRYVSIHEYKLRQLINGELGYRNFNDFLNHYRIMEVSERLRQPDNDGVPVLTLALDSGFHSLSSFNRAFKNNHGMTPTEYRNQAKYSRV